MNVKVKRVMKYFDRTQNAATHIIFQNGVMVKEQPNT